MKTKIITSVVLSTLMAGLLVWAVSADFSNFTSEERTEIKTLMEKSRSGEELTTLEQAKIDEIKANFEGKRGDRDRNWEKRNNNLTDEERATIEAMSDEEREEYRDAKKLEREDKRVEMKALMEKSRSWEELTADEQAQIDEVKSHFKGKKGERSEGGGEKKGNWMNK